MGHYFLDTQSVHICLRNTQFSSKLEVRESISSGFTKLNSGSGLTISAKGNCSFNRFWTCLIIIFRWLNLEEYLASFWASLSLPCGMELATCTQLLKLQTCFVPRCVTQSKSWMKEYTLYFPFSSELVSWSAYIVIFPGEVRKKLTFPVPSSPSGWSRLNREGRWLQGLAKKYWQI